MAKIHFKYGAMNSGKSDTLIKTAYNYCESDLDVIVIKPSIDTKGGKTIIARCGTKRAVDISAAPDTNVRQAIKDFAIKNNLKKLSCILIDEAQFLTAKQVDQLFDVAKIDNISVIAYGLRADFRKELFPGSKRLFEIVDNIEKLPTMCSCGSQAEFNCRMVDGIYVFEGDQVAIDGSQKVTYNSLCGKCYKREQLASKTKPQQLNK
jgi:thymidine kinase